MKGLLNLRTRLALGTAFLILIALGAVYGLTVRLSEDLNRSGTQTDIRALASRAGSIADAQRQALVGQLYEVAYDPANAAQIRAGGANGLLLRLTLTLDITRAWMSDSTGKVLSEAGGGKSLSASASAADLVRRAMITGRADGFISDGKQASVVAAVRLNGLSQSQVLVVSRAIDSKFASTMSQLTGTQLAFVEFSKGGKSALISQRTTQSILEQVSKAVKRLAPAGVQASRNIKLADRTMRLVLMQHNKEGNIFMAVIPNGRELGEKISTFTFQIGIIAAVALAFALAGGLVFGQRITGSLHELTRAARQISTGQYDVNVRVRSSDELGHFVESFNLLGQSLKQRENKIYQTAHRDTVTGLPSRALFENSLVDSVAKSRSKSQQMALLTVVVDRLREVNDSLGRKASDSMLTQVAERLRRTMRKKEKGARSALGEGGFIARLGTYEFGIIVPDCDLDRARMICAKLSEVISKRVEFDDQNVSPEGRIGLAVFPEHGVDAGSLLYSADIAATHAKGELTRVATFEPSFERDRENQLAMLTELRQALDRNELYIAMQPKINLLQDGELMAEALMRWEHPERGLQNPGEFVPFAEKTGFITELTDWMVDRALAAAGEWAARGVPLNVSVNLSRRDLDSPDFTTKVVERLRHYKLRGNILTFEITEKAVMGDSPVVRQNLDVLWRLGIKIALDDFGAGFASLDELRALPLSYIKVDRHYVAGIVGDEASKIVVKSAIDLGHSLGVEVVAEGVETQEQLELLRELSCDQAQGYYVGKPLTGEEFEAWVRHRSANFGVSGASNIGEAPAPTAFQSEHVVLSAPDGGSDDDGLAFEAPALEESAEEIVLGEPESIELNEPDGGLSLEMGDLELSQDAEKA